MISLDGILHLNVFKKSYTVKSFNDFVDGLLNYMTLYSSLNSVLINNANIHHSEELQDIVEK